MSQWLPAPGNRCAFHQSGTQKHRYISGKVVKLEITSRRIWVHVRVNRKLWNTRKPVYRVPLGWCAGYTTDKGHYVAEGRKK